MRIALAAIGLCLLPLALAETAQGQDQGDVRPSAANIREDYRARLNENTVTIMAGSSYVTDLSVVQDIAAVLDDGDDLRVLPMVGRGHAHNLKDVLFLRGVDMGITQANILNYYARTGELGPNFRQQVTYVAKLFNEEIHIVARSDIADIQALKGMRVNIGEPGSGTEIAGRTIFETLGIDVQEGHLGEADALQKLKAGEIAAMVTVTGKPAPALANLDDVAGLKLLPVPYPKELESDHYPATLTHDDYPRLIPEGQSVDTVAVCVVLVSFNWKSDNDRYRRLAKFVDRFFSNFDKFLEPPRHPKWREVNFAATLEGWQRSPLAQNWIDRAKTAAAADPGMRNRFDTFLAQADTNVSTVSDEERAKLFRDFLEWSKRQNRN